jgi:hypothetical protein
MHSTGPGRCVSGGDDVAALHGLSHVTLAGATAAAYSLLLSARAGHPRTLTATQLVDHLLTVPADTAAAEASKVMSRINFVSTYAFSKLLTEQLLDDPDTLPGVGKAIIRPSLISSIANDPYPG